MTKSNQVFDTKINQLLARHYERRRALADQECPSAEDLLDFAESRLAAEKAEPIREHLPYCPPCQDVVLSFRPTLEKSQLRVLPTPLSVRERVGVRWSLIEEQGNAGVGGWIRGLLPAGAFALAASVLAVIGLNLYPSRLSRLSYVDTAESVSPNRSVGADTDPLATAYQHGIASLIDSQTWILRRVDARKVDQAILYLQEAKNLAQRARNQTYIGECAFYLGKAYLKKRDVPKARAMFEEVLRLEESSMTLLLTKQRAQQCLDDLGRD